VWFASDMKLYQEQLAGSMTSVFPELGDVESIHVLRDGFRSIVVETPHGEVFKIAKSWDDAASHSKEFRILPVVRGSLPVAVPYPVWIAGSSKHFPFGVIGYPRIDGIPLTPERLTPANEADLSRDLADFLVSLQGLPIIDDIAAHLPTPRAHWDELDRLRNTLSPALRELFPAAEYQTIRHWWNSFLNDPMMQRYVPRLQHGDFQHENLLVGEDTGRLTGVVDFEAVALGDPAQDFANLLHMGRPFTLAVLHEYSAAGGILDEGLLYRTQRLWELSEFVNIGFAIRTTNQRAFEIALDKLRNGPLLNGTTRKDTSLWPPQQR
jgi:aminoglycoside 2''-phosphotransferase